MYSRSIRNLAYLFGFLSITRKTQLVLLPTLSIVASACEVLTLSLSIPFFNFLSTGSVPSNQALELQINLLRSVLHDSSDGHSLTLLFGLSALFSAIARISVLKLSCVLSALIGNDIGSLAFSNTISQSYAVQMERSTSETLNILSYVDPIIGNVLQPFFAIFSSLFLVLSIVSFLFITEPTNAVIVFTTVFIFYLASIAISRKHNASLSRTASQCSEDLQFITCEALASPRDLILASLEDFYISRYSRIDLSLRKARASIQYIANVPRYLIESVILVSLCIIVFLRVDSFSDSRQFFASIAISAIALLRLLPSAQLFYNSLSTLSAFQYCVEGISALLRQPSYSPCTIMKHTFANASNVFNSAPEISIEKLCFAYPSSEQCVISGLTVFIPRGSTLGIVGGSGSGKSTLIDIVASLLTPSSGSILVDGSNLFAASNSVLALWRRSIAYVQQSVYLMDATIIQNIVCSRDLADVDYDLLSYSCEVACISDFILSLPEGYNHCVGERGCLISGGQIQRIAIARAIYRRPRLLILDEATSALDQDTQERVIKNLSFLSNSTTSIVVAHRPEALRLCDYILNMQSDS